MWYYVNVYRTTGPHHDMLVHGAFVPVTDTTRTEMLAMGYKTSYRSANGVAYDHQSTLKVRLKPGYRLVNSWRVERYLKAV